MEFRLLPIAVVVSLLSVHSVPIRADVLAVSVAPPSPIVNQAATVTVTGTNPCGAVHIDFGDGTAQTYPITVLPFNTQHTWTTTGPKTITATGQGNCTGQATLTVQVTQSSSGSILQLCARVDCGERPKMSFLKPEITTVYGLSTPGGILAITGNNFGTKPGSVVASLRTWSGGSIQRTLEVTVWTNTVVGVRWPADIRGVRQQSGALALTNAGDKRDWRSVTFSPELDLKTLPQADVQVVSCGTDGNRDQCNRWTDPDDESPGFLWLYSDSSIFGGHGNVWGAVGNDKGTDRYQIALENDWVLEAFHWRVSVDPGEGFAFEPSGFTKAPTWSPSVTWNVSPDDRVFYAAVVTIAGPIGVPHK
jgi:hypothetical protein